MSRDGRGPPVDVVWGRFWRSCGKGGRRVGCARARAMVIDSGLVIVACRARPRSFDSSPRRCSAASPHHIGLGALDWRGSELSGFDRWPSRARNCLALGLSAGAAGAEVGEPTPCGPVMQTMVTELGTPIDPTRSSGSSRSSAFRRRPSSRYRSTHDRQNPEPSDHPQYRHRGGLDGRPGPDPGRDRHPAFLPA